MSTLIAPLLRKLVSMTQARALRWEATATEATYIASRTTPGGAMVFELTMEDALDDFGSRYGSDPALYVRRAGGEGSERKVPVIPEDDLDLSLLGNLWALASSAETREFLEDVLKDLGVAPEAPPEKDEDPFGDQ